MMLWPATASNRQICDGLRSSATPHGQPFSDFGERSCTFDTGSVDQLPDRRDVPEPAGRTEDVRPEPSEELV
jgi:hypothetical protein